MATPTERGTPKYCGQCGAALPPGEPRFCIECGHAIPAAHVAPAVPAERAPATGPTVRLANARAEQAVVGGTVRLPTSGAIPPGLWLQDMPPGQDRVVAVYAPLHAIVGGWSGTTSDGWRKRGQSASGERTLFSFETTREWFPAPGHGQEMRLRLSIGASSFADEGRTRRGFTYRVGSDPPMEVLEARWFDSAGKQQRDMPVPQIQLMAPPRVKRVSDFDESIGQLSAREAEQWAKESAARGVFRLLDSAQQRTPVGRGLPLTEVFGGSALLGITGKLFVPHRVLVRNPLTIRPGEWRALSERMHSEAAKLGLDLGTDAAVEWWIDQHGYDGAIFERGAYPLSNTRTVVAFRRSQIAAIAG